MDRKAQYLYQIKNLNNNQNKKSLTSVNFKKINTVSQNLNSSFSKEFTNMSEELYEEEDENNVLAQSYSFSQNSKYREQYIKEPLNIILDNYILSIGRNIKKKKIKFITSKDMSKLDSRLLKKDKKANIEEYLQIKNNCQDEKKFNIILNNYLKEQNLKKLNETILHIKCKLNFILANNNVGPILTINYLFDDIQKTNRIFQICNAAELVNQYNKLNPIIYRYRQIKGDGNCYYRVVMFRYLEKIILEKNIILLKKIIMEMKQCFDSKEIQDRLKIKEDTTFKPDLHLKIMILILKSLEKGKIKEAHELFVKCILTCQIFDYGLILYFRYILYLYIKENENKLFSNYFPIKVGNLLPLSYENEKGEFYFDKFYKDYLLKMFSEAEKIIIYLTPFVLGINLDIIIFGDNEDKIAKRLSYEENSSETDKSNAITLLNRNDHYELIYTLEEYNKYPEIFKLYEIPESNIENSQENKNNLENSCGSGFFLFQSNKNIIVNGGKTNYVPKNLLKNLGNIDNNIDDEIKKEKEINLDRNTVNYGNQIQIKKSEQKKPEMERKTEIEKPFGHPENLEDINYLEKIDNMFSDKNSSECLVCHKSIDLSYNKYNLCNICLEKELLTKLTNDYTLYLINKSSSKDKFKIKPIEINTFTLYIKEIFDLLLLFNNINNENELINYLKSSVCIKCYKIIDNKKNNVVKFPCGCRICNKEELEQYFTIQNEITDNYTCICGYKYEPKDLYSLCEECYKIEDNLIILLIINIFNKNILCKGCSGCGSQNKEDTKIKYMPDESTFCFEKYIKSIKQDFSLDHFLCKNCKKKYNNQNYICFYCKKMHLYNPK